ncbi:hypothetical protein [Lachnobacterium bovis]|jgi:FMN-dependent NADH-azoreductase|uniref:Uncharacterized protein n=1 Tax=Lachnobacterium bovis DSM 14045 TaxID=1122142 RepID=A0A1H3JHS1_9FIRM|nr:hypothetical protein [Lachnobacterium bovis]MBQ1802264.1 hypothetical protein [Lachnobacterium sp.]SDY38968.1 hypothetical protein SAMN02910414_01449 [Lachnobacterium bovis DSM 14045]
MSQAKVDLHKKEKRNRAKVVARNKLRKKLFLVCTTIIGIALIALIARVSIKNYIDSRPAKSFTVNSESVDNYLSTLSVDDSTN